tara:strand:+ start:51 stop:1031 length:981 start_codon:yes stop_codon:yes gene_type:complete
MSVKDIRVINNMVEGYTGGDGDTMIRVGTRGTSTASQNGPSNGVIISGNILKANGSTLRGIYVDNDYQTARVPMKNLTITNNQLLGDADNHFREGIGLHGMAGGIEQAIIENNIIHVGSQTGATIGGAIGINGSSANGEVRGVTIASNRMQNLSALDTRGSTEIGLYLVSNIDNIIFPSPNSLDNFYYAVRTGSGLGTTKWITHQSVINTDAAGQDFYLNSRSSESMAVQFAQTFAANDLTPAVWNGNVFLTAADHSADRTLTQLDAGFEGQVVQIIEMSSTGSTTHIADGGNFKLAGDWDPGQYDSITLVATPQGTWIEIGRSDV